MFEAGHCPLRIVTEFAHEHGMEILGMVRMNDVHDSFYPLMSKWKHDHSELCVSQKGKQTDKTIFEPAFPGSSVANLYVTALDYSYQAVRDHMFSLIEEMYQGYDLDGVELDFIRHPVLFKNTFEGHPAAEDKIQIMTSLLHPIRTCMDEVGVRRGLPMLLAVRGLNSFSLSLKMGLDLQTWLEEGIIDILIAGGYAPFSQPVEELAKATHSYGVPLYPYINTGPVSDIAKGRFLESSRALASKWYAAGADGVYFFNLGSAFVHLYGDEKAWRSSCRE